jgi:hypothetical protein
MRIAYPAQVEVSAGISLVFGRDHGFGNNFTLLLRPGGSIRDPGMGRGKALKPGPSILARTSR